MRKLRVGIMGTRGIPNHYGGFEQFAEYLSVGLAQRGHEVTVYNSSRHPFRENEWNGVQIIHCVDPEHRIGTAGQFFYDLNCINDARRRSFDILLHLGYTSDSIWYWRWPKGTINMMNVDGMEWMRSKYNRPTRWFLKKAEGLAARHATVLVADSLQMQRHFATQYHKHPFYIPYGADPFTETDAGIPSRFDVDSGAYFLLVARMEPENNIEMILQGYLEAAHRFPLLVIGNMDNKFGRYLLSGYQSRKIRFVGSVYDQPVLNNLRYFSTRYFHGHSVGGTNPSLLEAMACRCHIAAHNNAFNKAILLNEADYFLSDREVAGIIDSPPDPMVTLKRKHSNLERIKTIYSIEKNIADYEKLMLSACEQKTLLLKPRMPLRYVNSGEALHQTDQIRS
jgi:glycosyltransferase involved in cell wall biosynthesis